MASWRIILPLLALCGFNHANGESILNTTNSTVDYYKPVLNTTYALSTNFDMRGMGPLFNSTTLIIDLVVKKEAFPEGAIYISDGHVMIPEWKPLLKHYTSSLAAIAVIFALAFALTIGGYSWLCCCMCRYEQKRRPFDRKNDGCLKGLFAILLIALLTLYLFGCVGLFASQEHFHENLKQVPENIDAIKHNLNEYSNSTVSHLHWILVFNYKQLADKLNSMVDSNGDALLNQIEEIPQVRSVRRLNTILGEMDAVRRHLKEVSDVTASLRKKADSLNTNLSQVKSQLLTTLENCNQPKCKELYEKYNSNKLGADIKYSQIPDVSEFLSDISSLLHTNVQRDVANGNSDLDKYLLDIKKSFKQKIPALRKIIDETGLSLENKVEQISIELKNAASNLNQTSQYKNIVNKYNEFLPYIRLAMMGVGVVILTVIAFMALGLICGVCGKRPDVYGATDCCDKGAGSKWLRSGMCIIFLMAMALAIVIIVFFLAGVIMQRFICDPLIKPQSNKVFPLYEEMVVGRYSKKNSTWGDISAVLSRCHSNKSIYETLQLEKRLNLTDVKREKMYEISKEIDKIQQQIQIKPRRINLLTPNSEDALQRLADLEISDFDSVLQALQSNVTTLNLDGMSEQLINTANQLSFHAGFQEVTYNLNDAANKFRSHNKLLVEPMMADITTLQNVAVSLQNKLKFNHSTINEAFTEILTDARNAQTLVNSEGKTFINNISVEYTDNIKYHVSGYLDYITEEIKFEVGRCGPISHTYNATVNHFCRKILMPANGYWMSITWCVLLFVPILVVANRLARLYLHVDSYPGPIVEAEYLYDAYADRDTVPLAKGSKRSTLDIEGKIAEWRCRATAPPASPSCEDPAATDRGDTGRSSTQLLLEEGGEVICQLVPPPAALIEDLKTRFDAKDEDNESGIHESDQYKAEKRTRRAGGTAGGVAGGSGYETRRSGEVAAPAGDVYHARRYNDMAPKNCVQELPRYHGPTEYERPPPYYYPGPNNKQ